jgi:hypothetical protein
VTSVRLAAVTVLAAIMAFYQEHDRCGELDGGVYGDRVLDGVLVRRGAGARCDLRLDSRQPSSTGVSMRLIGLAVVLTLSMIPPRVGPTP